MGRNAHAALAALVLSVAFLVWPALASARPGVAAPPVGIRFATLPGLQTGPAPWGPGSSSPLHARLARLGLPILTEEQLETHIHAHLDVYVHGVHVPVPPLVGIDVVDRFLTVLHTHDASGVVHIESASSVPYVLGMFFGVWGVRLDARCIGRYCGDSAARLRAFVGGRAYHGDPSAIILREREEIVLTYGTKAQLPDPVPVRFAFAQGL